MALKQGNSARSANWMRTLEFAIWERAQTLSLCRHSSENTSQVVENAYLLLEFSSPGVSARAHPVFCENTLQVASFISLCSEEGVATVVPGEGFAVLFPSALPPSAISVPALIAPAPRAIPSSRRRYR
jgi:hypothetical protein